MFEIVSEKISKLLFYFSIVPLSLMVALTAVDVVVRYVFHTSIYDAIEIMGLLLAILVSMALPYSTYQKEHVTASIFVNRLTGSARNILDILTSFIAVVVCGLLAWWAIIRAVHSLRLGEFIGSMEVPVYPAKFMFAFGCLMTTVVLTGIFIKSLSRRNYIHSIQGEPSSSNDVAVD